MAREDIQLDVRSGELLYTDKLYGKNVCGFVCVDTEDYDSVNYCFNEVTVTFDAGRNLLTGGNILVDIPYLPDDRKVMLRFSSVMPSGNREFLINPYTNAIWFPVVNPADGKEMPASELCVVNGQWRYDLHYDRGKLYVYSGSDTDLMMGESLRQNELFLLKAMPGNFYQWPTTGVGLTEYLHGNMENSNLAQKIQSEFRADGMVVENAYMDSETGDLFIEAKETSNGKVHN